MENTFINLIDEIIEEVKAEIEQEKINKENTPLGDRNGRI